MRLLLALAACTIPALAWAAEPVAVEIPSGDAKVRGQLYKPEGSGPFAVVIGLHGCDGLFNAQGMPSSRYRDWAQRLAAAGFAVIYPDSYGSRGLIGSQCTVRSRAVRSERERVNDIQAVCADGTGRAKHDHAAASGGSGQSGGHTSPFLSAEAGRTMPAPL